MTEVKKEERTDIGKDEEKLPTKRLVFPKTYEFIERYSIGA